MKYKKTTYSNYTFYWATRLSEEDMGKINEWVYTLTQEQRELLNNLLSDKYQQGCDDEAEAREEY